jgi:hypothetical protein
MYEDLSKSGCGVAFISARTIRMAARQEGSGKGGMDADDDAGWRRAFFNFLRGNSKERRYEIAN